MSLSRKEHQDVAKASGQPMIVMEKEKEKGLTSKQEKFLEDTMHRHDKALKKLAQMWCGFSFLSDPFFYRCFLGKDTFKADWKKLSTE